MWISVVGGFQPSAARTENKTTLKGYTRRSALRRSLCGQSLLFKRNPLYETISDLLVRRGALHQCVCSGGGAGTAATPAGYHSRSRSGRSTVLRPRTLLCYGRPSLGMGGRPLGVASRAPSVGPRILRGALSGANRTDFGATGDSNPKPRLQSKETPNSINQCPRRGVCEPSHKKNPSFRAKSRDSVGKASLGSRISFPRGGLAAPRQ